MLKVACESCQAPYQIDERRVPPAGLKMRCPKCGHSFLVALSGTGDEKRMSAFGTPHLQTRRRHTPFVDLIGRLAGLARHLEHGPRSLSQARSPLVRANRPMKSWIVWWWSVRGSTI